MLKEGAMYKLHCHLNSYLSKETAAFHAKNKTLMLTIIKQNLLISEFRI